MNEVGSILNSWKIASIVPNGFPRITIPFNRSKYSLKQLQQDYKKYAIKQLIYTFNNTDDGDIKGAVNGNKDFKFEGLSKETDYKIRNANPFDILPDWAIEILTPEEKRKKASEMFDIELEETVITSQVEPETIITDDWRIYSNHRRFQKQGFNKH